MPAELLIGNDGRVFNVEVYPSAERSFYGRPAWQLGDDGDTLMVAGHDRRSLAALNALRREESKAFGCWPVDAEPGDAHDWWCSKATPDTPGAVPVVWTVA